MEQCRVIDAMRWMRQGILGWGFIGLSGWRNDAVTGTPPVELHFELYTRRDVPAVRIIYRLTERGEPLECDIRLQTRQPQHGGIRWWFTCPLVINGRPCGRRVQKLFLPPNARQFGCRHCYNLTYESRRLDAWTRRISKAQEIRVRLGGGPSLAEEFPARPQGMWRRTYERLRKQVEEAEDEFFGRSGGRGAK